MNGLCLEKSRKSTYEDVIQHVEPSRVTDTYQPIQNLELLNMLMKVAGEYGLELTSPVFGLASNGQKMFGVYEVAGHDHFGGMVRLMMGVRNSFDAHMSAGICFGSKVFVCDNLCFSGYAGDDGVAGSISHKHTRNIKSTLYERLFVALSQVNKFRDFQNSFYGKLQESAISQNDGYGIIIEAARQDLLPKKDILDLSNEWLLQRVGPSNEAEQERYHPEFAERNAWTLMNAFTEYHKKFQNRNAPDANKRSIATTNFFLKTFVK